AADVFQASNQVPQSVAPNCVDVALDNRLMTRQPLELIRERKTVPFLIGENGREDGRDPNAPVTAGDYVAFVHSFFDPFGAEAAAGVLRGYPVDASPTPAAAESNLYNDFEFGRGNRDWALAAAADEPTSERKARPVYKYRFVHTMADPESAFAGAFHG